MSAGGYRWENKVFAEGPADSYYNLLTHRQGKKNQKIHPDYVYWEQPRVAGPPDSVIEFLEINNMTQHADMLRKQIYPSEGKVSVPVDVAPPKSPTEIATGAALRSVSVLSSLIPGLAALTVHSPSTDEEPMVCSGNLEVSAEERDRIDKLSFDQLEDLCDFSFWGVRAKAKVRKVIDGDTFDLCWWVPMRVLSHTRTCDKKKCVAAIFEFDGKRIPVPSKDTGFYISRRVRLARADADEHNKPGGPIATALIAGIFHEMKNEVYITAWNGDKYGRTLVDLYRTPDLSDKGLIVNELLAYSHPVLGHVYNPYGGGTKEKFEYEKAAVCVSPTQAQVPLGAPLRPPPLPTLPTVAPSIGWGGGSSWSVPQQAAPPLFTAPLEAASPWASAGPTPSWGFASQTTASPWAVVPPTPQSAVQVAALAVPATPVWGASVVPGGQVAFPWTTR